MRLETAEVEGKSGRLSVCFVCPYVEGRVFASEDVGVEYANEGFDTGFFFFFFCIASWFLLCIVKASK